MMVIDGEKPERKTFVGNSSLSYRRDNVEVQWPFGSDGLFDDLDLVTDLWSYGFKDELKLNPEEHPLLFCESSRMTDRMRETFVETIFETYSTPATFLAKNAVLSSFASGID